MLVNSVSAVFLIACCTVARAQVDVSFVSGFDSKSRWYVWLIVGIAGACLIMTLFFVIRGFMVARRRKLAFRRAGLTPDEEPWNYTEKHIKVLEQVAPAYALPRGGKMTPMQNSAAQWEDSAGNGTARNTLSPFETSAAV